MLPGLGKCMNVLWPMLLLFWIRNTGKDTSTYGLTTQSLKKPNPSTQKKRNKFTIVQSNQFPTNNFHSPSFGSCTLNSLYDPKNLIRLGKHSGWHQACAPDPNYLKLTQSQSCNLGRSIGVGKSMKGRLKCFRRKVKRGLLMLNLKELLMRKKEHV